MQWFVDLLQEVKGHIDEKRLAEILEDRGRACISPTYVKKAKDAAKDTENINTILNNLENALPMLKREGDRIYVIFPKCYCHKVKGVKGDIPDIYCNCSKGWVKEMFEQALGRTVNVNLEASILRGDKDCRLEVILI